MKQAMPKKITAEETTYIYFTKSNGVPNSSNVSYLDNGEVRNTNIGGYAESLPIMRGYLSVSHDVRLVLIPSFFHRETADVHYLYWNDEIDLDALDAKVDQDNEDDEDFHHSIKTHFNKTRCLECGRQWDTLVVDPGDPYVGAPGLLGRKENTFPILRCPNCGTFFRIYVVKVLQ